MKFLCLICADTLMEQMPPEVAEQHYRDYTAYIERISRSGHYLGCNRLQLPGTAKTLRVRDGSVAVTDGPYAETKEHLGGYFLIEARDIDEAVEVAAGIPGARHGCVEVRPVAVDARTQTMLAQAGV
jgi:hypothetical protein